MLTFSDEKNQNIFDYVLTVSKIFVSLCIVEGLRDNNETQRQRRKRETHRTTKEAEKDKTKRVYQDPAATQPGFFRVRSLKD